MGQKQARPRTQYGVPGLAEIEKNDDADARSRSKSADERSSPQYL